MAGLTEQHTSGFAQRFERVLGNVCSLIRGKNDQVALALVCVLAEGHLLVEDVPGTGKTSLAKALARSMGGKWSRIQFTPDLLPSDVTGGMVYDQRESTFSFTRGPVFANVVLGDEINRASPKTQSAMLEVMEERQVTVHDTTHEVPSPFVVLATQNPVEQEGTYRLPEAQLDRFMMRLSLGYPSHADEVEVLRLVGEGSRPEELEPVLSIQDVDAMTRIAAAVHVDEPVRDYIVRLATATRDLPEVRLGVSTRGAISHLRAARAFAIAQGRGFVSPDDVKAVAQPVMAHRLLLTPEAEIRSTRVTDLVDRVLQAVSTPTPVRA